MTMPMVIAILMLIALRALVTAGCDHTKTYSEFGGPGNDNNRYYIPATYDAGTHHGYCSSMGSQSNIFKREVDKTICNGRWCKPDGGNRGNGWGCKDAARECYEVEHIIPLVNNIPELRGCDVNIFGNAVMAYGVWNNRLGNDPKFFCEKEEVYGAIWRSAYKAVLDCCGRVPTAPAAPSVAPSAMPGSDISWIAAVSGAVALLLGAVGACAACFAYKKRSAAVRANTELNEWVGEQ